MLGRLLIGIVKGLVVGGLLGFALVKLGLGLPGAVIAYIAAAFMGVIIGLIAGKPIWAKDAKIEAGTKAAVGALLAIGLMAAARTWLLVPLPPLGTLVPDGATLGGFAMTSLAAVAALLGGFYDADNNAAAEGEQAPAAAEGASSKGTRRIAQRTQRTQRAPAPREEEEELDSEPDKKRSKK